MNCNCGKPATALAVFVLDDEGRTDYWPICRAGMLELNERRGVDPQALRPGVQPLRACGKELAVPSTPCRIWAGPINNKGYGVHSIGGHHWYAHRYAWTEANGPIPPGMLVCHRCDTPACYEITHLFLGTQSDNMKDAWIKGRGVVPCVRFGEDSPVSKLSASQVAEIRSAAASGIGQRAIAKRFGICQANVSRIVRHSTWKTISEIVPWHAGPGYIADREEMFAVRGVQAGMMR